MMKSDRPAEHTEELIRNLIESNEFKDKYPEAYKKWASSEELLWKSDSQDQLTTIGHLCREAIQEFSEVLALDFNLQDELPEKSKTKTRIRRVLEARAEKLSNSEKAWLSSLIDYWKAVSDLIQKQEHGAMREGKELVWEDARRVVFSTLIVMYEIHKSLCQD
jgi:hypothetical protein